MIIIPAVDIKDGKCVQLVQGEPGTEQIIIDNPAEVALNWESKVQKDCILLTWMVHWEVGKILKS